MRSSVKRAAWRAIFLAARCLLVRRYPVAWWRGIARSGEQATLLVAGEAQMTNYLPERFFAGNPHRELIGHASIWGLPGLLRRLRPSADLTIALVDRLSAHLFFGEDYLRVPDRIGSGRKLREDDFSYFRSRERPWGLKSDVRRALRYRWVVSHSEADLKFFYESMYVPYMRNRFGEGIELLSQESLRCSFRQGGIIWIEHEKERIAGGLFRICSKTFVGVMWATANGNLQILNQGALAAVYLYMIDYAHECGCSYIYYGWSSPSLHDGTLRYKRKWGITLKETGDNYFYLLVHWNSLDGVVADFLSHTSLIFRERGGLSAIHALGADQPATEADVLMARRLLWIDGLQRLYLFSAAGWSTVKTVPQDVVLTTGRLPLRPDMGRSPGTTSRLAF